MQNENVPQKLHRTGNDGIQCMNQKRGDGGTDNLPTAASPSHDMSHSGPHSDITGRQDFPLPEWASVCHRLMHFCLPSQQFHMWEKSESFQFQSELNHNFPFIYKPGEELDNTSQDKAIVCVLLINCDLIKFITTGNCRGAHTKVQACTFLFKHTKERGVREEVYGLPRPAIGKQQFPVMLYPVTVRNCQSWIAVPRQEFPTSSACRDSRPNRRTPTGPLRLADKGYYKSQESMDKIIGKSPSWCRAAARTYPKARGQISPCPEKTTGGQHSLMGFSGSRTGGAQQQQAAT